MFSMPCGCEFEVVDGHIQLDLYNLPDCKGVWDYLGEGKTKGVFQLDSGLGKHWVKEIKPQTLEHLSAIGALLRPGCLKVKDERGISTTEHYSMRKNGDEEVTYFHPLAEQILGDSYGLMIYQEHSIKIAEVFAGFDLKEADNLRKGIGKKISSLIASLKDKFIDGCKKVGILDEAAARDMFEQIEKSQRYNFNKCLSPNTLCQTKTRGQQKILGLEIGEYITSPYGWVKVVNKYYNGVKPLYRWTFDNEYYIDCTPDHKIDWDWSFNEPHDYMSNSSFPGPIKDHMIYRPAKTTNGLAFVVKSEYLGELETMDIEVDHENHVFYGNGIATSNSHSVGYGMTTYGTAYLKYHFPLEFFVSNLRWAHEKPKPVEEIRQLVLDAKLHHFDVYPPDLRHLEYEFYIRDNNIYFGLTNIRGIGEKKLKTYIDKLKKYEDLYMVPIERWSWEHFLVSCESKSIPELLIKAGACNFGMSRNHMLFELGIWDNITDKAKEKMVDLFLRFGRDSLENLFKQVLAMKLPRPTHIKTDSLYKQLLKPPYSLKDEPYLIATMEKDLLSLPLTCSRMEKPNVQPTATCLEFLEETINKGVFAVEISDVKEFVIKTGKNKGKKMGSITINDLTGEIQKATVFNKEWEQLVDLMIVGNTILVQGERNWSDGGFAIKNAWQI